MKIYLDGCDGSGKSTLATYLSQRLNIDKFTLTKNSEKSLLRYMEISNIDNVVCDRTFMSEIIYPTVFGRVNWLSEIDISNLMKKYKSDGLMLICTAPIEIIKNRLIERGDEFKVVLENLEMINNAYVELAKKHNIAIVDTGILTKEMIADQIERKIYNGKF